jgi:predicted permease
MERIIHDIRYALRKLARTPAFTLIVVATLALAIGATTAMFTIVNGVLLNPLGFTRPDRLVYVQSTDPTGKPMYASPQDLLDYRDRSHSFVGLAAVDAGRNMSLARESAPAIRITSARVGASFFSLLGVPAEHGRTFAANEDAKGAPKVVVLSHAAWQRDFGGDPRIVGQRITLDNELYDVIGIAPATFTFPGKPDLWYPAEWESSEIGDKSRGWHTVAAIARLKDGVTLESAKRDLESIAGQIAAAFPRYDAKIGATASPLRDAIVGNVEAPLWAMLGAVGFVLLIACANDANLLLVRASSRESEIAVRTALGAGRRRLIQQLVTESMLLALAGAAAGTLLASWVVDAVSAFGPAGVPRIQEIAIDSHALLFTSAIAVLTGLAFGLLPALHVSKSDVSAMLRAGARGSTGSGNRTRSALVVVELALGMVLLVGAGLLLRSFARLTHVDPGFRPDHLVVFDVALSDKKYEYDAPTNAFVNDVQQRLAALPGTQSVAVAADRPIDPNPLFEASTSFTVDGQPKPAAGLEPESRLLPVSPSFFQTLGLELVRGRTFVDVENRIDAAPVVVINETLARRYFPGRDPIGLHLTFGLSHTYTASPADSVRVRGEIVGIVKDVHTNSLSAAPPAATYVPYATLPAGPTFLVRTSAEPLVVEREIRSAIAAVDRTTATFELGTMDEALSDSVAQPRFYALLLSGFAAVALLLAALGIYGVVSYGVSQRTREFGIRLALGATGNDVTRLVVGRGASLTAVGVGAGLVMALVVTRAIRGLLFGVGPFDAVTFGCVAALLALVAIAASWLPARQAARVDPVTAMRAD